MRLRPLTAPLAPVRLSAALVFIVFGIGKFTDHASEAASFASYGLPSPDVFTSAVGVLEIAGGAALLLGVVLWPVALALAGNMLGAIVVSGLLKGEAVSLTLAPALLAAMIALLVHEWRQGARSIFAPVSTER